MTTHPEAQLIADYADLGVSTGYIGNIYYGPIRDDRSFRIFTTVLLPAYRYNGVVVRPETRANIEVFDVPRNHKGVWTDKVEFDTSETRAKLDELRARVARGEARVA